jgi:hypothetical protein
MTQSSAAQPAEANFAAWEQPAYLTADLREAFKTLR